MLVSMFTNNWDYWELGHKVTFDPEAKLIIINEGVTSIDVQVDIYSDSKEWLSLGDNAKYLAPMRAVGGDLKPDLTPLGRTFFLINGWRILLDHAVAINGNIYSDDFASPYVVGSNVQLSSERVSNLVDIAQLNVTNQATIALAVWQQLMANGLTAEQALLATLTTGKFIALK